MGRYADVTGVTPALRGDLEAIAIDEMNRGVLANENIRVVDVADDLALLVNDGERSGEVGSGPNDEAPIGLREGGEARLRAVELVNGLASLDPRHKQAASDWLGRLGQSVDRPGGDPEKRRGLQGDHARELVRGSRSDRLMVELGDKLGAIAHLVDRALAP